MNLAYSKPDLIPITQSRPIPQVGDIIRIARRINYFRVTTVVQFPHPLTVGNYAHGGWNNSCQTHDIFANLYMFEDGSKPKGKTKERRVVSNIGWTIITEEYFLELMRRQAKLVNNILNNGFPNWENHVSINKYDAIQNLM